MNSKNINFIFLQFRFCNDVLYLGCIFVEIIPGPHKNTTALGEYRGGRRNYIE